MADYLGARVPLENVTDEGNQRRDLLRRPIVDADIRPGRPVSYPPIPGQISA
ncbi:hypothetical protein RHIZ404_230667 [Rhizobium sp. EC-SD404]|nr:hypothetical protein RHIZ404_230667 [Rhizobium sp. EC-SD404]